MFFRTKQQVIIFCSAGTIILSFVLFMYLPQRKRLNLISAALGIKKIVIEEADTQKDELPMLEKQIEKLRVQAEEYKLKVPEQRELGSFLHEISALMTRHNLKSPIIEPSSEVETEKLNCILVSMKCKGKLSQIFEFYKSLKDIKRLIRIEYISLESKNQPEGEVDMVTEAIIYYQPVITES